MRRTIEYLWFLTTRPSATNACIETPRDLYVAIRGLCVGAGDPDARHCLGSFPEFVRSRFPECTGGRWDTVLARIFDGKDLPGACKVVHHLLEDWKERPLATSERDISVASDSAREASDDFELLDQILRNPDASIPGVSTFREVVAYLWGIDASRSGSLFPGIPGEMKFGRFLNQTFQESALIPPARVVLKHLGDRPVFEVCVIIADLIRAWRSSN